MAGLIDIGGIVGGIADIAGKFIKDPNKVMEFQLEVEKLAHQESHDQIEVNKTEAASGSVFVAGWRPFVGWSCGCAFIYSTMVYPTLQYFGGEGPHLDDSMVQTVLLGMLGIGAMRTVEKIKGVSTNNYTDVPKTPPGVTPIAGSAPEVKKKKHFHFF